MSGGSFLDVRENFARISAGILDDLLDWRDESLGDDLNSLGFVTSSLESGERFAGAD